MPTKLKRVVVLERIWSRAYLQAPENRYSLAPVTEGHRCCLGFACLVEGFSEKEIIGRRMPDNLDWKGKGKNPWMKKASPELLKSAVDAGLWTKKFTKPTMQVGAIAAEANDAYHDDVYCKPTKKKEELLRVLRNAFREAGYIFVLKRK